MTENSSKLLPQIERLTGRDNWATWKFAVQTFLELEDLWCVVKPNMKEDGSFEAVDAVKDRKARAKVILLLDPVNYVHVREAMTARAVWDKLETAFEDTGLTRRVGLLHKLIKTELSSCESMAAYVNQIISTAHQLNGIGFPISDVWVGTLLLAGLPDEYRPMIMALENSGIAITGDAIKTKLLQEVQFSSSNSVLAVNKRSGYGSKQTKKAEPPKGPKCRKCGKYGHIAKDCRSAKKENAFCAVLSTFGPTADDDWYIDSGASVHMTRNSSLLENVKASSGAVVAANGERMKIAATGSTILKPCCLDEEIPVHEVQFIPDLSANLLSVNQIVRKGHTVIFNNAGCKVINEDGDVIATGTHQNDLFKLEQQKQGMNSALACSSVGSLEVWHRRLGHLNINSVRNLANGLVTGIKVTGSNMADCAVCPMGKHCRHPFSKNGTRAEGILDLVHSDINGPMEVGSLGGSRYIIVFVDDKSRRIWTYFLKTKSEVEVTAAFKDFHAMAERQSGQKLKVLRTDNGKEYVNQGFQKYLKQHGIIHQKSNEYTPQQNGLAERANRSIVERARCMLFEAKLSKGFWAEAVATAVYLLNRSPTRGHDLTPEEAWTGKKPDLSHVRIFGTRAMVQVPKQKRKKWDVKSKEAILTGFDEQTKGYRLYDLETKKIIISREVHFINEGVAVAVPDCPKQKTVIILEPEETVSLVLDETNNDESLSEEDPEEFFTDCTTTDANEDSSSESDEMSDNSNDTIIDMTPVLPPRTTSNPPRSEVLRRSGRKHKLPGKYANFKVATKGLPSSHPSQEQHDSQDQRDCQDQAGPSTRPDVQNQFSGIASASRETWNSTVIEDPVTHQEALSSEDSERWKVAMKEEYQSLLDNKTWTLTELPEGRKAIKCKWVYKTKHDAAGNIDRYKARLVIKGFSQRKGVDYDETYSPVVRHSSLRYMFALAAKYNLSVDQMDAITAFLQGDLDEEIYMQQPPCFERPGQQKMVCRLNKALYGLKQSSRVWNAKLDAALKKLGLKSSNYDPCLYFKIRDGKMLFVAIYVDDLMLFSNNDAWKDDIKAKLSSMFRMKDLGPAKNCLGIRVTRTKDGIALDQEAYIESILARFKMENSKEATTPMNTGIKLTKQMSPQSQEEHDRMVNVPYQEAVGCLMYLAQCTRPDILFAVNQLSRFNTKPGASHWEVVKHLMRYLRGTSKMKLQYSRTGNDEIVGYSDADWAADTDDRKSTSGYVFLLQGGAVSWCCKRQPTVALSTCEAEYMALSAAVQEASWWQGLITQLSEKQSIKICCDNQSTICIARNGGYTPRTKHIDIRHHFIRDAIERKIVSLCFVSTENQIADGLTKPLQRIKLERNRLAMGITRTMA